MRFTRIILSIVFVLFASTTIEAKHDKSEKSEKSAKSKKILVCHVGSKLGSQGETYMQNPDCEIPVGWEGKYECPDAGKVDLISVSANAKHIGNAKHTFLDAEGFLWEDYPPEGDLVGDDPLDFEEGAVAGIDRGCELEQALTCPCWSSFSASSLLSFVDPCSIPDGSMVRGSSPSHVTMDLYHDTPPFDLHSYIDVRLPPYIDPGTCAIAGPQVDVFMLLPDTEAAAQCYAEAAAVYSQTGFVCPD